MNAKRILTIQVIQELDETPDASYLGAFSDTAKTEFAVDRRHTVDCNSVQPETLATVEAMEKQNADLDARRSSASSDESEQGNEVYAAIVAEQDALIEEQEECADCDCGGVHLSRQDYRYFNPGTVEPFKVDASWIPKKLTSPEDRKAYWLKAMWENARADYQRMEALQDGAWEYIGIRATAEIVIDGVIQRISSGGLWGIESDSTAEYLDSVKAEELKQLRTILYAMGITKRAIAKAVKGMA